MWQTINHWLKNSHLLKLKVFAALSLQAYCFLCVASHTKNYGLCNACLTDLPWASISSCPQCGLNADGEICGSCISSPPDFDATYAVFVYSYPVDAMIQRYKYNDTLSLSHTFGHLIGNKMLALNVCNSVDLIIPMPMHPTRLKQRGFNQALEIARIIDQLLHKNSGTKLDYKSLTRQILTPPQASLPLKDRVKNIKGAFHVSADKLSQIQGKRIAIVDDVMTTGASLNELAKTLKQAGATRVECWVVARTLPH